MESDKKKPTQLIFLDFIYAIAELTRGMLCLLTNSKGGDQKPQWNGPGDLLVCAFMATSLARVQETDKNISATDTLCVLGQTAISFWSHGLFFT